MVQCGPHPQVRSTINIHWEVVGGNLQKRQNFVLNHRWRIIYTDQETQARRYSTPSKSVFIDLSLGYTTICLDEGESSFICMAPDKVACVVWL